jgi:hypothetical protein
MKTLRPAKSMVRLSGSPARNSLPSPLMFLAVQATACMARALNSFALPLRTAESWFPRMQIAPFSLRRAITSFGDAPYPTTSPRQYVSLSPMSSRTASRASRFEWTSETKASSEVQVIPALPGADIAYIPNTVPPSKADMGRKTTLMGFSLFGFVLGFLAWLLRASVSNLVSSIGLNQDLAGAILAGIAGGFLMLIAVLVWSAVD